MSESIQYPFLEGDERIGKPSSLPFLPRELKIGTNSVSVLGLLDTGAMVRVMPYSLGLELGAVWEEQSEEIHLTGNLARSQARVLAVTAIVGTFPPVRLRFAWSENNQTRLVLGQLDFFLQFDVFFSRSREFFEIQPKQTAH